MSATERAIISQSVQKWARDLLGARGYVRAMNSLSERRKLLQVAEMIEEGRLDAAEARTMFADAASRGLGLDAVIGELCPVDAMRRTREARPTPVEARPVSESAAPIQAEVFRQVREQMELQVEHLRNQLEERKAHAVALENLVRGLVERSVLDATRIHGLEALVMAIANGSGIGADAERVYAETTAEFLRRKVRIPA